MNWLKGTTLPTTQLVSFMLGPQEVPSCGGFSGALHLSRVCLAFSVFRGLPSIGSPFGLYSEVGGPLVPYFCVCPFNVRMGLDSSAKLASWWTPRDPSFGRTHAPHKRD